MEKENKNTEKPEDDNLYVYTEPDDEVVGTEKDRNAELDNSGPNYSQAEYPEDGKKPEKGDGGKSTDVFIKMLEVLFNPVEGWKSIRRKSVTSDAAQQGCFYPVLAVFALSKFMGLVYNPLMTVSDALVSAVSAFVSFFFGYFCIMILLKALMPKQCRERMNSEFAKVFVIINLSSLCVFFTITDLLPMLWAILIFLPLWTVYTICRGSRFFRFPEQYSTRCTAMLCVLIIGVPCLLDWALSSLLPR